MENELQLIYTLSLSLLALISACFFLLRRRSGCGGSSPPSPPALPIIGNFHQLGRLIHRSLANLSRKHGPLMLLWFGRKPVLVISSAAVARRLLKDHDLAFSNKPELHDLNRVFYDGNDVINLPYGDKWRKLRNILLHELLSSQRVRSFAAVREEETAAFVKKIEECSAKSQPVNLSALLAALSSDLISRAAFGKKYGETEHGKMFLEFVDEGSGTFQFRLADYVPWLAWIDRLNGCYAAIDRLVEKRDLSLDTIIEDHLNSKNTSNDNITGILLGIHRGDIPGVSIDLMSLKGVILDVFTAGTETTTTTLIWLMTELMRHPAAMKNLQDEIQGAMKGKSHITDDDLLKFPYLKAVIKETLRLHPPLAVFGRAVREDVNVMGYEIEAKTIVLVNAWAIGHDPECWEDAERFMPERFLNSSVDFKGHDFHLIPFGAGRRVCPGLGFATLAMEHAVSNLMLKFDWALPDGVKGEDLDVSERPGLAIGKRTPLILVATINSNV